MNKLFVPFILLFLTIFRGLGQDIAFRHLTTNDGLSHYSALTLYQDERGFIWAGTREGLNLYNGNSIESFKHEKENANSLQNNYIKEITGNGKGEIYIRSTEGICCYNFRNGQFTALATGMFSSIHFNGQLFVAQGNKVFTLNNTTGKLIPFCSLPLNRMEITCLHFSDGQLWIGTAHQGAFLYVADGKLNNIVPQCSINNIYKSPSGIYWFGTPNDGLYSISNGQVKNYKPEPGGSNRLYPNFVRACCEDSQGNLWLASFDGLCKLNKGAGAYTAFDDKGSPGSIASSSVWCIISDNQGTLWFGTYYAGIYFFNPGYEIFTHYKAAGNGLSFPIVGKMTQDKNNNLWICTDGGGLNMLDRKSNTFKWFKHSAVANSISHNNAKTIYYDAIKEIMWIGTHLGGLNKLDIKTDYFVHYLSINDDSASLPSNVIYDIVPWQDQLIISTQNGVCIFNPLSGKCSQLFKNSPQGREIKVVVDLLLDNLGKLWMSIDKGVACYRFETNTLTTYKHIPGVSGSLSSNSVSAIYQDSRNRLWFCTLGGGLDLYRPDSNNFANFDIQNSPLPGNSVYQINEYLPNRFLVITDKGMTLFEPGLERARNFEFGTGFPLSNINDNALYISPDQQVFLGGTEGMVSFNLKGLDFSKKPYSIFPHKLFVNGTEVKIGRGNDILDSALYTCKNIKLKSSHHVFSVEFASSNFIRANADKIEYKLFGFSDQWSDIRGQNYITYTNLNPGNYTLAIRAKGKQSAHVQQVSLNIEIMPPFYATWFAYIVYALTFLLATFFILRTYFNRIKLQQSLKYEQKHIREVEKLNQAKLNFFTNISHEFRTPLTLITGQAEGLLHQQSFAPGIYKKILAIYNSSLQMNELITELLDFRKQEEGLMKLLVSENNLISFIKENIMLFQEHAKAQNINFTVNCSSDTLVVWFDPKQIQKLINNLLSNAFKHTGEGGSISVSVMADSAWAVIMVSDNGTGIAPENTEKIFEPYYQVNLPGAGASVGTGIGLALSKGIVALHGGSIGVSSAHGKGATFTVKLKLGNAHFDSSQRIPKNIVGAPINDSMNTIGPAALSDNVLDRAPKGAGTVKDKKILIIEDSSPLRDMLAELFAGMYIVESAADGQEGLEKIAVFNPDIVLSDVLMPKMTGIELCKHLKRDIATCHIPFVLLTSQAAVEHNLEGLLIGADDYITKPFDINILVSRCNNLVNSRIVLKEKFSNAPGASPQMLATNKLDKDFLDKAVQVIEKYIDDPDFNVQIFSREMGMARTNLFTKIKAITGQTPNDFLTTVRLKKAAFLLKNKPELNITDISDITGFSSSRYLSKRFKEIYHISPLAYRKGDLSS